MILFWFNLATTNCSCCSDEKEGIIKINKEIYRLKKVTQGVTYKERCIKKETLGRVDREYIVLFT